MLMVLDDGVGDRGEHQQREQDVQFVLQTQEVAVGEAGEEPQRLPYSVVAERCLFVLGEEDPVACWRTGKTNTTQSFNQTLMIVSIQSTKISLVSLKECV